MVSMPGMGWLRVMRSMMWLNDVGYGGVGGGGSEGRGVVEDEGGGGGGGSSEGGGAAGSMWCSWDEVGSSAELVSARRSRNPSHDL
jgi:hypothetical protein